MFKSDCYVTVN